MRTPVIRVLSVRASRFMAYDRLEFVLPARGVVLVTGPNGSGKSALTEAISYALWGSSLRAGSGWSPLGDGGWVEVDAKVGGDLVTARRARGTKRTPSDSKLGPHNVFAYGHVFHQKAIGFARLGDADAKRLLESVVGLDAFTLAQHVASKEYDTVSSQVYSAELEHKTRESDLVTVRSRLRAAKEAAEVARQGREVDLSRLRSRLAKLRKSELEWGERATSQTQQSALLLDKIQSLPRTSATGKCPTCKQDWPGHSIEDHNRRVAKQRIFERLLHVSRSRSQRFDSKYEKAAAKVAEVARRIWKVEHAPKVQKEAEVSVLREQRKDLKETLHALRLNLGRLRGESDVAREVESVFSPRGVRSVLLTDALKVLGHYASSEAALLGRVRVRPRLVASESGASRIVTFVEGAGKGSYEGCSTGEQRRVDVSLMMALGKLASETAASAPRWRFTAFDEVLDSLDLDGVHAMGERIQKMGERGCVLVISHREEMSSVLPFAKHWRVRWDPDSGSVLDVGL